ncbi:hypothetical protein [Streptomyces sp. PT12]|uniref:hypothetical protein n=1 Tax=Streptomyces sp. PT12 TaxID=1510197 RepID=UPI00215C5E33|nr:hypothetical protein [Streptomyces sp. PT12]
MRSGLLERALRVAAARAAAPGDLKFTERQLYYELCRVLLPAHLLPRRLPFTLAPPLGHGRFAAALGRLGDVPGLLAAPPHRRPRPGAPAEPDLYDYGLPRLLVCQDPAIARMLVANDWHLEAACPVLAADDLPLDPRLTAALGRVPDAVVLVLHDASAQGTALPGRVRAQLGPGAPRVAALGLTPRHAASLHLARGRATGPALPAASLDRRELRWLARGRYAEVAAVNPAHLLRTLHRLVRDGGASPPGAATGGVEAPRDTGFLTWPTR